MTIRRYLAVAGAALLMTASLAPPVNAGIIDMDFTSDAATKIVGATSNNEPAGTPAAHDWVESAGTSAKFGVDMTPYGFAGATLDITGKTETNYTGNMRMTRWEGNGLAICSKPDCSSNPSSSSTDEHTVDGRGSDESILFAISTGMEFAVRYVTFGYSDSNDDAVMSFVNQSGATVNLNINLDYHNDIASLDYSNCSALTSSSSTFTAVCTIDIYKLAANKVGALVFDPAYDLKPGDVGYDPAKDYSKGQDAIYNYLASSSGFEFKATQDNDNWKLRQVGWVVMDVPTPGTVALLLGGLGGLGWFARRRRASVIA